MVPAAWGVLHPVFCEISLDKCQHFVSHLQSTPRTSNLTENFVILFLGMIASFKPNGSSAIHSKKQHFCEAFLTTQIVAWKVRSYFLHWLAIHSQLLSFPRLKLHLKGYSVHLFLVVICTCLSHRPVAQLAGAPFPRFP